MPAPGIDLEPEGYEGFHVRVRRHAFLRSVTAELLAHNILLCQGRNHLQDFDLLITDGFTITSDWRLHSEVGQNLKEVILDNVADGSGLVVKRTATLNPKIFRH